MKLAVLGATGGTGIELVRMALEQQHEVCVLVRTPFKLGALAHNTLLTVMHGDATSASDVRQVFRDADAVLSCLGLGGSWANLRSTTFHSDTAAIIIEAMREEGVRRLIAITSSGVEHDAGMPFFYRWLVRPLLMPTYADMQRMEQAVETAPGLVWTLVRPSYLTDGESEQYRVRDRKNPERGWMISRTDAAKFMLGEAIANEWVSKHPALAM